MKARNSSRRTVICGVLSILCIGGRNAIAEKELMYDPEKGIIFVENGPEGKKNSGMQRVSPAKSRENKISSDIHVGRRKDPPEVYFKSGLEYYRNNDFNNALKNFTFADSAGHRPEFRLWIGKTLRSLDKNGEMLKIMYTIIKEEPDCDVADDALLELALYYKKKDDYDKATRLFTQLIEQYPFGTAFSTGEELREIAREQRRLMRAEMINILTTLGHVGEDLPASYRNFQKANNLSVTEIGDFATIKAIKEQHRRYLEQEELKLLQKQQFDKYRPWIYGAVTAGTVNIMLLLALCSKIQTKKRQLLELQKIVKDLDVTKL